MMAQNFLPDDELLSVNGGVGGRQSGSYSFENGDCYANEAMLYRVMEDYSGVDADTMIRCKRYRKLHDGSRKYHSNGFRSARSLVSSCTYLGKDVI